PELRAGNGGTWDGRRGTAGYLLCQRAAPTFASFASEPMLASAFILSSKLWKPARRSTPSSPVSERMQMPCCSSPLLGSFVLKIGVGKFSIALPQLTHDSRRSHVLQHTRENRGWRTSREVVTSERMLLDAANLSQRTHSCNGFPF